MFKAAFIKIKRACFIALVPRIVRGDGRYTTKKIGKSPINALRKVYKSTDSGSKDGKSDSDKCKHFIELVFGPSKPNANPQVPKENKTAITNIQELNKDDVIQSPAKEESKTEKSDGLVSDYFSADEDTIRQDYINKNVRLETAAVDKQKLAQVKNNPNVYLEIVKNISTYYKLQETTAKDKDEKLKDSESRTEDFQNNCPLEGSENIRSKPSDTHIDGHTPSTYYKLQATTAKENNEILKDSESRIEDFQNNYPLKGSEDIISNPGDKHIDGQTLSIYYKLQATTERENDKILKDSETRNEDFQNNYTSKDNKDTRSNIGDKHFDGQTPSTYYKLQATTAKENNEKLKDSESRTEDFQINCPLKGSEDIISNPGDKHIDGQTPSTCYKLQATTAKENEETLKQKIEDIDETPHVEASVSKVEEFSIPPKTLGDRFENISNSTVSKFESDYQETLDKIAQNCMNTSPDQIDNKILEEMETADITCTNPDKSMTEEEVILIDRLDQPEKIFYELVNLYKWEYNKEPIDCTGYEILSPSFELPPHLDRGDDNTEDVTDSFRFVEMEKDEESTTFKENTKENAPTVPVEAYLPNNVDLKDSRPHFDINKPIIDPYDKKSLAYDQDDLEESVMDSKLLDKIGKPSQNKDSRDNTFAEICVTTSEATPVSEIHSSEPIAKDTTQYDVHIQPMYDRELNWRPYPSFEAREEVINFDTERNKSIDYADTETTLHQSSEPTTHLEQSYEPHTNYIYTSTSVSSEPREQISHSFVQPEEMINPLMDKTVEESKEIAVQQETLNKNVPEAFEPLPSLNADGNVSLTELLRRVRMRNRLEYCREFALHTLNVHGPETLPAEGKCGKKPPRCPPRPPKCPPPSPCPPPPAPPCPKPCPKSDPKPCAPKPSEPKPCSPLKKNPCNKFKKKCTGKSIREVLTLLAQTNPKQKIPQNFLLPLLTYKAIDIPKLETIDTLADENIVFRLNVLGKILLFHCTEAIDANLSKNRSELSFARDFEPWTPIPSLPMPKKEEKKPFVCPKEGCKAIPPPKLNDPCNENPCRNFPKRSNFSLTDLFSFSLVESLVYKTR